MHQIRLGQQLEKPEHAVFTIGSDDEDAGEREEEAKIEEEVPVKTAEEVDEIEYQPVEREQASSCYHRLPKVGQRVVLDQLPSYFKIEQLIVPQTAKKKPSGFFAKWWKGTKEEPENKPTLEPRFIAFDAGHILIMKYLPEMPLRDYGVYNQLNADNVKPLPEMQWNAEVTLCREIFDLDEIHLANYRMVQALEDPSDNYLILELFLSGYHLEKKPGMPVEQSRDETVTFNIE